MNYEKQPERIGKLLGLPRREGGGDAVETKRAEAAISRKGANSERASLIGQFADRLNEERDGKKYKKLTYAAVGFKLSHLALKDLYYLWSYCKGAKNFSSTFWWSIDIKKHI